MELISNAIAALQAETTTYPQQVQMWMKLMGLSFLASLLFAYWRVGARWIFAILVVNLIGLVIGKMLFPDASRTLIGTFVHLLCWPGLLWAAWRSSKDLSFSRTTNTSLDWVYISWFCWASLLVAISIVFDLRAAVLMLVQ